jgi:hypothetical protein
VKGKCWKIGISQICDIEEANLRLYIYLELQEEQVHWPEQAQVVAEQVLRNSCQIKSGRQEPCD